MVYLVSIRIYIMHVLMYYVLRVLIFETRYSVTTHVNYERSYFQHSCVSVSSLCNVSTFCHRSVTTLF